jgi:hypothetical protein
MANIQRNFIAGRMNKSLDERLVPNGEYINAVNVRLGSTEDSEIGAVENSKGNLPLTELQYVDGTKLSSQARCIGAFEDGANLALYWFVHDPAFTQGATGKLDLIISFDVETGQLIYHVISIDDGNGINTTLNFNPNFLITGVDKIDNLLFFTDNTNPPRVININQNYGDPLLGVNVDVFNQDDILVIKKPPTSAPIIEPYYVSSITDAYLEDKFLCFAYRYKYANNEFSAISQFSEPAFTPGNFDFTTNSYLNEGMVNQNNAVSVTFNTGSSSVTDVQLLFKEADSTSIKVIKTLNKKKDLGSINDTNTDYQFTNREIFTVLPDSEILRLYDNVPQLAKAQTLMGNRLMYGNYMEGYDLKTSEGVDIDLNFTASYKSEAISLIDLPAHTSTGNFTYTPTSASKPVSDSVLYIDLSPLLTGQSKLTKGTRLSVSFGITFFEFDKVPPSIDPTPTTAVFELTWSYTLIEDYATVNDFVNSTDFQEKIGTDGVNGTIQTIVNAQAGLGNTLTDVFNRTVPENLDSTYSLVQTGRTSGTPAFPNAGQALRATASTSSNILEIQNLAAFYGDGAANSGYAYWGIVNETASFSDSASAESLHSNRGYEVGIVYMDNYNRASTALVSSQENGASVNIPCSNSIDRNFIQVEIPSLMKAPAWATKYKFVIKPTKETYETIYSNVAYRDTVSSSSYFLLDGENAAKVEAGDTLIVKADNTGPTTRCIRATVLEKEAQANGFISIYDAAGTQVDVIGGVYMKINASNFSSIQDPNAVIAVDPAKITCRTDGQIPTVAFPFFTTVNRPYPLTPTYDVYDVPVGSRIVMRVEMRRNGTGTGADGRRNYTLEKTLTASTNYTNMANWFIGDNVASILDSGVKNPGQVQTIENTFISPQVNNGAAPLGVAGNEIIHEACKQDSDLRGNNLFGGGTPSTLDFNDNFYYRIYEDTNTQDSNGNNLIFLLVSGSYSAGRQENEESMLEVSFTVYRGDGATYVFETEPQDALPDAWYENSQSFNISNGLHLGNVQNQTSSQPAIINPGFTNCYSFGNGVESYRIRDSIKGKSFNLGNRVFTTSNEEFKAAHRFADITYSGVFNDESNVNRLNEFNLGLANFKPLEETYGDVEILFARETDILVLQEDKISYVLAGKNLLSDSTGGGVVTSVPEVLGTQIARIEEFGISNHPESFATFGQNKFFTDAKRNVVIKLTGSSAQNEILTVISNEGMRSWFRDLFAEASATQKLGGYDPYMQEYVFTTNTIVKPETELCTACGVTKNITIVAGQEFVYCVELGETVGPPSNLNYVEIDYVIPFENTDLIVTEGTEQQIVSEAGVDLETEGQVSGTGYIVQAIYDGVTYTTGIVYQSGTLRFPKPNPTPTEVVMIISSDAIVNDTIQVTVKCPEEEVFSVYSITLTTNANAGQFSHTEFSWTDSTVTSPTQSDLVTFLASPNDPIVSQYRELEGPQASGIIPPDGSTITMRSNKINFDNFQFDPTENEFRYLRTDALFENNSTDISILLAASVQATPINSSGAPTLYSAQFGLPSGGNKLYLIYDLRNAVGQQLCYSSTSIFDACCNCTFTPAPTPSPTPAPTPAPAPVYDYFLGIDCVSLQAVYVKANQTLGIVVGDEVQYQFGSITGCASLYDVGGSGQNGEVIVQVSGCGDSRCST